MYMLFLSCDVDADSSSFQTQRLTVISEVVTSRYYIAYKQYIQANFPRRFLIK